MSWLSINPNTEPAQALKLAAHIIGSVTEKITPEELADAYNSVEFPDQLLTAEDSANLDQLLDGVFDAFSD